MAAFSPPPGYRYPITTWRSAPADASDSSVRARTPGLFSTSARQSVMCFTVTDISDTSFETQSILSRQNPIHALPVVLAEPQQDFYRRRHDAPLHFGKLALRDAQERGKIILSLRSPELSDTLPNRSKNLRRPGRGRTASPQRHARPQSIPDGRAA